MTWPTSPESLRDLPLPSGALAAFESMEDIHPGIGTMVCGYVEFVHDDLEAVSGGDLEKEQRLGMVLVCMAYRAASEATPEDEKRRRFAAFGVEY